MTSATTQPTVPDWGLTDWIAVLHNAVKVPSNSPRYMEARQVAKDALAQIRAVNTQRNTSDPAAAAPGPSAGQAALDNAAQSATAGFADEILGSLMAAHGPGKFGNASQDYGTNRDAAIAALRDQLSESRAAHPIASIAGNAAGAVANPLNYVLGPMTKGLGAVARGAVWGGTLGGAQAFGEGAGSPGERIPGAVVGTMAGAAIGAVAGKLWPIAKVIRNNVLSALGRGASKAAIQEANGTAETVIRAYLTKQGFPEENVNQIVETWRAGGKLPPAPKPTAPPAPPVLRPGETVEQIAPKGFAVSGARPTPAPPANGSFWEQVNGTPVRDLGKGQTLPYYPRGGSVEQGIAPGPQSSMPNLAPNQNTAFADFLKGATPEDLASRVGTLRALGVPLPANAETELLAYLTGAR